MNTINKFSGKYSFLSNFYPCLVVYEGREYPSAEHAFQAAKSLNPEVREVFRTYPTPADAKYFGKRVTLRDDWESVKAQVMTDIIRDKFTRNRAQGVNIRQLLLDTGDATLVEGNRHGDRTWGTVNGEGKNLLGKILMNVRDELKGADQ